MVKQRISETDEGIQDELEVKNYNQYQRNFRDKGFLVTNSIIKSGITHGIALEIGPGPGYLGLEWLKKTNGTILRGVDISQEMIKIAEENAGEYGLQNRVKYVQSDAQKMPFEDNYFDAAFTNGSLHEWSEPKKIFNEMYRVLKSGGRYYISDLRRNINPLMKGFLYLMTKPKEIWPGVLSSINAAYTIDEINDLLQLTEIKDASVKKNVWGIEITGKK
jgi:ubiquinone/menaquinone biosynthesis C-methylase UbiE